MKNDYIRDSIILPSRKIISGDIKIKQYYFLPGLLSVIFLTAILSYQVIYTFVVIFGYQQAVLQKVLNFLQNKYIVEFVVVIAVFLILYYFLVPIFEGGLIKYIDNFAKQTPIGRSDAFGYGVNKFLPFFEYNTFFAEFRLINIFNAFLFMLRLMKGEYFWQLTLLFLIVMCLAVLVNILFAYAKYAIILNNKLVFPAIGESIKIAILNPKMSIKLYFLIFVLNLRVIINLLVFLFFPMLIVAIVGVISSQILMMIALTILLSVFFILILFISYLTAVLDVFKAAVWYYAYEEGRKKIDDEDDDD